MENTSEVGTQTSEYKMEVEFTEANTRNARLKQQLKAAERLVRSLAVLAEDRENITPAAAPAQ
jgi:hypothetical protein